MAVIRYYPSDGAPVLVPIHKPVTTLGRGLDNDVRVADPAVVEHHAQIVFDGRDFQLEEVDKTAEILINGKKKRRARLVNGDRIVLGKSQLGFSMFSELMSESESSENDDSQKSELAGL